MKRPSDHPHPSISASPLTPAHASSKRLESQPSDNTVRQNRTYRDKSGHGAGRSGASVFHAALRVLLTAGLVMTIASLAGAQEPRSGLRPAELKTEYRANPMGVEGPRPRLGWALEAAPGARGVVQKAYQVRVATSRERLKRPDLWDSGRVESAESVAVEYAGKPVAAGQRAYWQVRVWGPDGSASPYSEPAWWEAALQPSDWKARWIRSPEPGPRTDREMMTQDDPAPLLRKEFVLAKPVARARAYVTGLGYYELRLNGERVGSYCLDPGWTPYAKRVLYSTYDVTEYLRPGRNAAGAMLGNGWWNPLPLPLFSRWNLRKELAVGRPRFLLQLEIEYRDGTRETVLSDESWKTAPGPLLRNSVYLGEVYDARKELPGWDRAGFDDSAWKGAVPATEPVGRLVAQTAPAIRATDPIDAVRRTEPKPGVFIYDLGENFAGWATLKASGPAGTRVQLRYGELLNPDGTLNPLTSTMTQIKNSRVSRDLGGPPTAWQSDVYLLRGANPRTGDPQPAAGSETYTPRFTFRGFRYVEVTGYPGTPPADAIRGWRLHAGVEDVGSFTASDPLYNKIQEICLRAFKSNLFSVQSDCPHREKLGYGGDIVATSDALLLNLDMGRFYAKTVEDYVDEIRPNGGFTETAPFVGIADEGLGEGSGPIGWGTAGPFLMWQLYQYQGDRRPIEAHYPAVQRWIELLRRSAKDGILDNGISDHESLVPKPRPLTGTAFYYYNVRLAERMARILGKTADADGYARLAGEIRDRFNAQFLDPATGKYHTGTQACQAFALFMGLAPEAQRAKVLQFLAEDIAKHDGHLTTGIFGTKYMLRALTESGRADLAHRIAGQKSFPGWGHMLEGGATTLWETWKFSDNVYSHNHPMFGSVSEWFYRGLAGINAAEEAAGWDRIVLRPNPVENLDWVRAEYRSVRGAIRSAWRREGRRIVWDVYLPPNTTASVHIPQAEAGRITEGGQPLTVARGVRLAPQPGTDTVAAIGSGSYRFAWTVE